MSNSADYEQRHKQLSDKLTAGEIDDDEYVRLLAELRRPERAGRPQPNHGARSAPRVAPPQPTHAASAPQPIRLWCALGGMLATCFIVLLVVVWFGFKRVSDKLSVAVVQSPQSTPNTAEPRQDAGPTTFPPERTVQPPSSPPPSAAQSSNDAKFAETDVNQPKPTESTAPTQDRAPTPQQPPEQRAAQSPEPPVEQPVRSDQKPSDDKRQVANTEQETPQDSPAESGTAARRLEYRWEPGRTYTYYVRTETDKGETSEVEAGATSYTAAEPGARHEIATEASKEALGFGTAFVVHPDGYLITCAHCVDDAGTFDISLGGKKYPGKVLRIDEENDLALIRVEAKGLTPLPLGDSESAQVGEDVRVVGFPLATELGTSVKATRGTLSGIEKEDGRKVFQLDAAVNPGNSGGPLVRDVTGEVIGVNSALLSGSSISEVGFAVPINYAKRLMSQHHVQPVAPNSDEKLTGPELVKRVSQSSALLTITSVTQAKRVELKCQSRLIKTHHNRTNPPESAASKPGLRAALETPANCGAITVDIYGRIVETNFPSRLSKDVQENAYIVIDPIRVGSRKTWKESRLIMLSFDSEKTETVKAPDSTSKPSDKTKPGAQPPAGLSRDPFGPFAPSGPGIGPRFGPFGPGRSGPIGPRRPGQPEPPKEPPPATKTTKTHITIPAKEEIVLTVSESRKNIIVLSRRYSLRTLETKENFPQLHVVGTGKTTFDTELGVPRSMQQKTDVIVGTGKDRRVTPIKTMYELVDGDELERYRQPEVLTATDLSKILTEVRRPDKRNAALDKLAKIEPVEAKRRDVLQAMKELLAGGTDRSTLPGLRVGPHAQVIHVLNVWGNCEEAVPIWIQLLADSEENVRYLALTKLPDLKDERIAAALAQYCVQAKFHRPEDAVKKLIDMGEVAEKAVIGLLDNTSPSVRLTAINALSAIGTEACLPPLEKLAVASNRNEATQARQAIKQLCIRLGKPEPDLPPVSDVAARKPGDARPEREPLVPGRPDAASKSTSKAAESRGKSSATKPARPPSELTEVELAKREEARRNSRYAETLSELASVDKSAVRKAAERLASSVPPESPAREVAEALEELAQDDDVFLRRSAVKALGIWGTQESVPKLIALFDHSDVFTRRAAFEALAHFKNAKAAEAVAGRLSDSVTRHDASESLKKMGSVAERFVAKHLEATDRLLQQEAASILKVIGTAKSIPALQAAAKKDNVFMGRQCEEAIQEITRRAKDSRTKKSGT